MSHNFNHSTTNLKITKNRGFGLVELLVSISILVLVMGIILARHSSFNSAVLLRNQAHQVVLHAREIQHFAVSVTGDSGDFRNTYGLHFNTMSGHNRGYKVFKDGNGDSYFNVGTGEEFGRQGTLDPRFIIDEITLVGSALSSDRVSVVFERPNFDARFFVSSGEVVDASAVEITVRLLGTTGDTTSEIRKIEITKTGQISVQ